MSYLFIDRHQNKAPSKIKIFDAFSGIGSQEMALTNLGVDFEIAGTSEVDKHAILAYNAIHNIGKPSCPEKEKMLEEFHRRNIAYNFSTGKSEMPKSDKDIMNLYIAHKNNKNFGDITLIKTDELPDFNLFTYSFPCKDISVAGRQTGLEEGSGTQSSLLWECERIIKAKNPEYLLMENVKNLLSDEHVVHFKRWLRILWDIGYISFHGVLNATDFGIPQHRERVIMMSIRRDVFSGEFDMPTNNGMICPPLKDLLEDEVDEKYYIPKERYEHIDFDLPCQDVAYCLDAHYYKGTSVDSFIYKGKRQLVQVGELSGVSYSRGRCYSSDAISPTLDSMNGGDRQPKITDGREIRRLTPLECWRIMGYSDQDFIKAKGVGLSDTKLYERAGRGIVVNVLEAVYKELAESQGLTIKK